MFKVAFITNICAHYRVRTYETFAKYFEANFYFFSAGKERYWQQEHTVKVGDFNYEYLPGFYLGRTRITPVLPWKLWCGDYEVYIKGITGRFALPITYLIARIRRKPFILWTGIWMKLQTPMHRLFYPLTRYFYLHSDAIVVYGCHVKNFLEGEGVPSERIFVAAHAVENKVYSRYFSKDKKEKLRNKLGLKSDQKIILYLGRLEKEKGIDFLLEAISIIDRNDIVLVIVGTGSEMDNLKMLAKNKNIENSVKFIGYIESENTIRFYALADICVIPSITTPFTKEPWGLVANEAMNQGVPVIATTAVGAAAGGLIQHGINGIIVPEGDSHSIAQNINFILDNPKIRNHMSRKAKEIIAEWDNENMVMGFRRAINFVSNNKLSK